MSVLRDIPDREIHPHHEIGGTELICTLRKTPAVLYGIFTELVQQFYLTPVEERIFGTPDVTWSRDPHKTGIWIDSELRWEAEHTEFRPAIYVKLGQIHYSTVDGSNKGLVRFDMQEGRYSYCRVGEGTVSFVHIGSTAGESCALAGATLDYLDAFSPVITDDFCFDKFSLASISPVSVSAKDSSEKYASVVTFSFKFKESWVLKRESPKLKAITLKTTDAVSRRLEVGEYWDYDPALGRNRSNKP